VITPQEHSIIDHIKRRALGGCPVSPEEKQWILDIVRREREPIHKVVMVRAANAGFNVKGIVTI